MNDDFDDFISGNLCRFEFEGNEDILEMREQMLITQDNNLKQMPYDNLRSDCNMEGVEDSFIAAVADFEQEMV